jgi:hypothetical protein
VADTLDAMAWSRSERPEFYEPEITDEELTALALAADADQPLDPDAVPLVMQTAPSLSPLPGWYMPPVMAGANRRWRVPVVLVIVAAFLLIDAFGLCITYGQLIAA